MSSANTLTTVAVQAQPTESALDLKPTLYTLVDYDHQYGEYRRLTLQHTVMKRIFDNRILFAPVGFSSGDCLLDAGTGTGAWAIDVASTVPKGVTVIGTDINTSLFPPPSQLAPNVTLSPISTLSFPADWSGRFKLVNQRMLVAGFTLPLWREALKELYRVLEPGGWIQLLDLRFGDIGDFPNHPKLEKFRALQEELWRQRGLITHLERVLPVLIEEVGFVGGHSVTGKIPMGPWAGALGEDGSVCWEGAFVAMKEPVMMANPDVSPSEFDRMMKELVAEWTEIPGVEYTLDVFYAQKPQLL